MIMPYTFCFHFKRVFFYNTPRDYDTRSFRIDESEKGRDKSVLITSVVAFSAAKNINDYRYYYYRYHTIPPFYTLTRYGILYYISYIYIYYSLRSGVITFEWSSSMLGYVKPRTDDAILSSPYLLSLSPVGRHYRDDSSVF